MHYSFGYGGFSKKVANLQNSSGNEINISPARLRRGLASSIPQELFSVEENIGMKAC